MSSETGRSADRHAAWVARERRDRAVQHLVRTGGLEEIRTSALVAITPRVAPHAPPNATPAEVVAEAIFAECGARLGAAMVEPNVVLTLGGYRGHTEFSVIKPLPGDEALVPTADLVARGFGVRLRTHPARDYLGRPLIYIELESLAGYEYASAQNRVPGVLRFQRRAGWAGLGSWKRKLRRRLQAARARGEISRLVDLDHALVGILKGYPAVAILGYLEADAMETDEVTTIDSDLPLGRAYACAEPNYAYPPELNGHPDIRAHRQLWNDALCRFYTSEWHLAVRQLPAFRDARRTAYDL